MTCSVKLIRPCFELETEYTDMVAAFLSAGENIDWEKGLNLPDGWVPSSTFWLFRGDSVIIGSSSLRHKLNDKLRVLGGHIGYQIRPDERQKGYGCLILKLTVDEAKLLGLERVLITCDDDNIVSAKIIEKNGGVLEDKIARCEPGKLTRRYWIDLHSQTLT